MREESRELTISYSKRGIMQTSHHTKSKGTSMEVAATAKEGKLAMGMRSYKIANSQAKCRAIILTTMAHPSVAKVQSKAVLIRCNRLTYSIEDPH